MLIVGCGCGGRALGAALLRDGWAVRGTTRRARAVKSIAATGAEGVVADPDALATLVPQLAGVSVVCWLLGSASGPTVAGLHGARLRSLLEHIVDTPVRGLVYQAGGSVRDDLLAAGDALVREAGERWHLRVRTVGADPRRHAVWLAAMTEAVAEVLR